MERLVNDCCDAVNDSSSLGDLEDGALRGSSSSGTPRRSGGDGDDPLDLEDGSFLGSFDLSDEGDVVLAPAPSAPPRPAAAASPAASSAAAGAFSAAESALRRSVASVARFGEMEGLGPPPLEDVHVVLLALHAGESTGLETRPGASPVPDRGAQCYAMHRPVLESIDGRPGISSNPSPSLKSNSFSMILEPLILASRVLGD